MLPEHGLKIVLVEPEIPQNAGNIARLCAATGIAMHLVRPLGFFLSDKHFKRAGMDYVANVPMTVHDHLDALFAQIAGEPIWLTSGLADYAATPAHWAVSFEKNAWIFFGKESAGLPATLLQRYPERILHVPMTLGTRGLNISTTAGIVMYEALRQICDAKGLSEKK